MHGVKTLVIFSFLFQENPRVVAVLFDQFHRQYSLVVLFCIRIDLVVSLILIDAYPFFLLHV